MNVDFFSGVVLLKALLPDWLRRLSKLTGSNLQYPDVYGAQGCLYERM